MESRWERTERGKRKWILADCHLSINNESRAKTHERQQSKRASENAQYAPALCLYDSTIRPKMFRGVDPNRKVMEKSKRRRG